MVQLFCLFFCGSSNEINSKFGNIPLFNFNFTSGSTFDIRNTPSQMGSLTEYVRKITKSARSSHPVYSFCALGKYADQINCIKDFVDFFYLDVVSSGKEIDIASKIIEQTNKPILVGIHLLKNGKLPSGETIGEMIKRYKSPNWIGIIASCVSIEIAENSINDLKAHNLPFGYKVNLWGDDEPSPVRMINTAKFNEDAVNLNTVMGKREVSEEIFKNLGKKFIDSGATILGGCCETGPKHVSVLSELK